MSLEESINEEESFEYDRNNEYRHRCCENLDILEEAESSSSAPLYYGADSDDSEVDSTSPDIAVTSQGPASPDESHVSFAELMSIKCNEMARFGQSPSRDFCGIWLPQLLWSHTPDFDFVPYNSCSTRCSIHRGIRRQRQHASPSRSTVIELNSVANLITNISLSVSMASASGSNPASGSGEFSASSSLVPPVSLDPSNVPSDPTAFHPDIQHILDSALKPSTRKSYAAKWRRFSTFAESCLFSSYAASIHQILQFLLELHQSGLKLSSIKVYTAAITYHRGLVATSFHMGQDIVLPAFFPSPTTPLERSLHSLDVRHCLAFYKSRTESIRRSNSSSNTPPEIKALQLEGEGEQSFSPPKTASYQSSGQRHCAGAASHMCDCTDGHSKNISYRISINIETENTENVCFHVLIKDKLSPNYLDLMKGKNDTAGKIEQLHPF
ncbi:Protein dopey-2 [Varanus komodoensis]|nr:Protein dopey-2 [Varanus komodoensis]